MPVDVLCERLFFLMNVNKARIINNVRDKSMLFRGEKIDIAGSGRKGFGYLNCDR